MCAFPNTANDFSGAGIEDLRMIRTAFKAVSLFQRCIFQSWTILRVTGHPGEHPHFSSDGEEGNAY